MKKIFLLLISVILISRSQSQVMFEKTVVCKQAGFISPLINIPEDTFNIEEHNTYESACITSDGGYISMATRPNGATLLDIQLVRTNASGEMIWEKFIGGNGEDHGRRIIKSGNGGYLIIGKTNSFGNGDHDIYLLNIDSSANVLWSKTYGGTGIECGNDIKLLPDGGLIIAGKTESFGAGAEDVYLIRTDATGNVMWSKTYGGSSADKANAVIESVDGFSVIGETESFGNGMSDIYLIKTDLLGNEKWSRAIGGSNIEKASAFEKNLNNGYTICGSTNSFGAGNSDVFLIQTDSTGTPQWQRTYGGLNDEMAYALKTNLLGEIVITGETSSFNEEDPDLYLIKTDASGIIEWSEIFGAEGTDLGSFVDLTADGGYFITGSTVYNVNPETYLIKTNTSGHTGCDTEMISSVMGNAFFNSSAASSLTNTYSLIPVYFPVINIEWEETEIRVLCEEGTPDLSITFLSASIYADSGSSDTATNATLESRVFTTLNNTSFEVYPNPADGENMNLSLHAKAGEEFIVVVYDALGRENYSKVLVSETDGQNVFAVDPLEKLSPGTYIITASSQSSNYKKILIVK